MATSGPGASNLTTGRLDPAHGSGAVRNLLSRPMEPRSIGCAPGPVLNGSHHRAEASRGDRIQWLGHDLLLCSFECMMIQS